MAGHKRKPRRRSGRRAAPGSPRPGAALAAGAANAEAVPGSGAAFPRLDESASAELAAGSAAAPNAGAAFPGPDEAAGAEQAAGCAAAPNAGAPFPRLDESASAEQAAGCAAAPDAGAAFPAEAKAPAQESPAAAAPDAGAAIPAEAKAPAQESPGVAKQAAALPSPAGGDSAGGESPGGASAEGGSAAGFSEISEDERREILAQIEGIVEKNRKSLSGGEEGAEKGFRAKKRGGLFPLLANAVAAVALAGGFFALSSMQSGADAQAREGARIFSDMERALINEIRRETGARLAMQDAEISMILASLEELEAQLQALAAGEGDMTQEQVAAQQRLIAEQEDRRAALAGAREERSRILDEARSQETPIRAQMDERARQRDEAPGGAEQAAQDGSADLEAARAELARLAEEQAKAAAAEAQIAGLFASVGRQVAERDLDGAEQAAAALRETLGSPAFQALRAMPARMGLYEQAAGALEALLGEHRAIYGAMLANVDRGAEIRRMEEIALLEARLGEAAQTQEARIQALQAEHDEELGLLRYENESLRQHLWQTVQALQALGQ